MAKSASTIWKFATSCLACRINGVSPRRREEEYRFLGSCTRGDMYLLNLFMFLLVIVIPITMVTCFILMGGALIKAVLHTRLI